jgi:hypothetical protein
MKSITMFFTFADIWVILIVICSAMYSANYWKCVECDDFSAVPGDSWLRRCDHWLCGHQLRHTQQRHPWNSAKVRKTIKGGIKYN